MFLQKQISVSHRKKDDSLSAKEISEETFLKKQSLKKNKNRRGTLFAEKIQGWRNVSAVRNFRLSEEDNWISSLTLKQKLLQVYFSVKGSDFRSFF